LQRFSRRGGVKAHFLTSYHRKMYSTTLTSPLRNMLRSPISARTPFSGTGVVPPPPPAFPTLPGVLPNVYYLDDPTDGATPYLLSLMGCALTQGGALPVPPPPKLTQLGLWVASVHSEHCYPFPVVLSSEQGGVAVDVRDPGDAWVRIVLHEGDVLRLASGVWHRATRAPMSMGDVTPAAVFVGGEAGQLNSSTALAPHFEGRVTLASRAGLLLFAAEGEGAGLTPLAACEAATLRSSVTSDPLLSTPYFTHPGYPHTRSVVAELCNGFYKLGWVTGTGGGVSIKTGGRYFMAPSGVQKERMQAADMFVLDGCGTVMSAPHPLPGKPKLRVSQCAPLFQAAFKLRGAGACIHTHCQYAVLCTLPFTPGGPPPTEFRMSHQEMIKGIIGHGYNDTLVVPILENTPHEADLAESMEAAIKAYPKATAVLVRRHGVYVWGPTWESAKTQAECYHYLFELAVRMRGLGFDPQAPPTSQELVGGGFGAGKAYGSGSERASSYEGLAAKGTGGEEGGKGAGEGEALAGWLGSGGTNAVPVGLTEEEGGEGEEEGEGEPLPLPPPSSFTHVVLDVEGCTTSLSFVVDTLFPFALSALPSHLDAGWGMSSELEGDIGALIALSEEDVKGGVEGAEGAALDRGTILRAWKASAETEEEEEGVGEEVAAAKAALIKNVTWVSSTGRKCGALKALQGHLWREGYTSGALKGHVYEDTPQALEAWVGGGKKVGIYSSGSIEAQHLLFQHTTLGDLRPHLSSHFDTTTGPKMEASSYTKIAGALGLSDTPHLALFATDSLAEAKAAKEAGMQVVVTVRPGNNPLPKGVSRVYPVATSLLDLC
jgi:methylthioribulose 1-phosphate dehydratase/enolase-phosphatase E1